MRETRFSRAWLAGAVLLALSAPAAAAAQGLTFAAGTRLYGEGEESVLVAAVRSEFPVGSSLLIEVASSLADIPDGVSRATGSVFEAQLQLAFPLGEGLAPYVGAGSAWRTRTATARRTGWTPSSRWARARG
jgi:hypothetical protein